MSIAITRYGFISSSFVYFAAAAMTSNSTNTLLLESWTKPFFRFRGIKHAACFGATKYRVEYWAVHSLPSHFNTDHQTFQKKNKRFCSSLLFFISFTKCYTSPKYTNSREWRNVAGGSWLIGLSKKKTFVKQSMILEWEKICSKSMLYPKAYWWGWGGGGWGGSGKA